MMVGRQLKRSPSLLKYRGSFLNQQIATALSISSLVSLSYPAWTLSPPLPSVCRNLLPYEPSEGINLSKKGTCSHQTTLSYYQTRLFSSGQNKEKQGVEADTENKNDHWHDDLLPFEDWTHNSARVTIPVLREDDTSDVFQEPEFPDKLNSTIVALQEMGKTSLWVQVHISRAKLIEDMAPLGLQFHHAQGEEAVLNLWLQNTEPLVPEFATHHIGVGGFCINSRNEILCIRELHRNYNPWKIPGGLTELGEHLDEAVVREVLEETGIQTKFRDVLCFRHTHGMANNRSDMYFVCRLDLVEENVDEEGNVIIPEPVAQEGEIETAAWIPYEEFREIVFGEQGSPVIQHVLEVYERGKTLEKKLIGSSIPGRKPSPIYSPVLTSQEEENDSDVT